MNLLLLPQRIHAIAFILHNIVRRWLNKLPPNSRVIEEFRGFKFGRKYFEFHGSEQSLSIPHIHQDKAMGVQNSSKRDDMSHGYKSLTFYLSSNRGSIAIFTDKIGRTMVSQNQLNSETTKVESVVSIIALRGSQVWIKSIGVLLRDPSATMSERPDPSPRSLMKLDATASDA